MKIFLSLLGLSFFALIIWAILKKPISESSDFFFTDPWGIVALADLYLGFFIFSLFIFLNTKNKIIALAWTGSLFILGNVISVIYLIIFLNQHKDFKKLIAKN